MVGGEGVVDVQDARSTETTLEAVEGMQFDKGFLSPYFVTDAEQMRVELENPVIMLYDKKMTAMAPLLPLLESILQLVVGHLGRLDARRLRPLIDRIRAEHGQATCWADIVGGWDRGAGDVGYFSVRLDLGPDGSGSDPDDPRPG